MTLPFIVRSLPERVRQIVSLRQRRMARLARSEAAKRGHSNHIKRVAAQARALFKEEAG